MASATKTGLEVKVIGNASNFWLWSERDGFDLTHPETSSSPLLHPRISLQTTNSPITIAPSKTALVIVDMQNFFLSRSLGRKGQGHDAEAALLQHALPAARKAGIQVIWLTWGLTDADLEVMSPTMLRIFKFDDNGSAQVVPAPSSESKQKEGWTDGGMGAELGEVVLTDGTRVNMGRMMMRDQWNTALHQPLRDSYEASLHSDLLDVWLRKNRVSGICDSSTDLTGFLAGKGAHIKTLLFAGVNIDHSFERWETAPPSVIKAFGYDKEQREVVDSNSGYRPSALRETAMEEINKQATGALSGVEQTTMRMAEDGAVRRRTEGIGFDIGPVKLANGQVVEGGRMLVRDTWNAAMPLDLNDSFKEGQASESNPDILIHKNRMSGFWDREMKRVKVLEEKGVRTLLFVGIKTDMCVMASLLDAWHAGFDVILLKDACGTTSPRYVSDAVEFNCARIWGFVSDSKALEQGVNNMLDAV